MLHALPELLDAFEAKLVAGEDPMPLLQGVRWSEVVGWPEHLQQARALQSRVLRLDALVKGLHAPLKAALARLQDAPTYGPSGRLPDHA